MTLAIPDILAINNKFMFISNNIINSDILYWNKVGLIKSDSFSNLSHDMPIPRKTFNIAMGKKRNIFSLKAVNLQ